jgi:uncharacterized membrane protein
VDSRRAESFSDGVFAVAITLLVVNLLPIASESAKLHVPYLAAHWPAYFGYVVSFLTIGIMWLNHHTVLAQVTRVTRPLLVLNLLLLMGVVTIPFPTALVADHLSGTAASGQGQATVAAVTYGLVMIAISVCFGAMWLYIVGHAAQVGAQNPGRPPLSTTLRFVGGNLGYVAATLIALVSPVTSLIMYGLLAVYYLFEHLPAPESEDGDRAGSAGATGRS